MMMKPRQGWGARAYGPALSQRIKQLPNMEVRNTMKLAITAKKVVILLMTMALAVALVACEGAVGKPGEAGKAGAPGEAAKQPPYVVLALSDLPAIVQGMSDTADLSRAFGDPDGETLTLDAISDDPTIATADVSGTTLTVTGVGVGTTAVVVTATDADGLKVSQSVQVTVTAAPPPPVPPVTIGDVKAKYPSLAITPTTAADVSKEIELPADHTLSSENTAIVTVAAKAAAKTPPAASIQWASATSADSATKNVWVVTAVSAGTTNVDVHDKSGASVHIIRVTVTVNPPAPAPDPVRPTATTIQDMTLYKDDPAQTIVLSTVFTHAGTITYEVSVTGSAVDAVEANGILTVTPLRKGEEEVTVTATADGLSVSVSFNVDVVGDNRPPKPPVVAPKSVGEIPGFYIGVGESDSVDVAEYFTPDSGLDFSVGDGDYDDDIVRVVVNGSEVTVTGLDDGETTITVTARNATDTATQEIHVNVEPEGPPIHPPELYIHGVGDDAAEEIRIDDDQTLYVVNGTGQIEVAPNSDSDTVWTVTGRKKGDATIRVLDSNGVVDHEVSVEVGNTAPEVQKVLPSSRRAPDSTNSYYIKDEAGEWAAGSAVSTDAGARTYHHFVIPYEDFFRDEDGLTDIETVRTKGIGFFAESRNPSDAEVVRIIPGTVTDTDAPVSVVVDFKRKVGTILPLEISIEDKSGEHSAPVTVQLLTQPPIADNYEVSQASGTNRFDVDVWQREGPEHTLTFSSYTQGTDGAGNSVGFSFVEDFVTGLGETAQPATVTISDTAPNSDWKEAATGDAGYFHVVKSGNISLVDDGATDTIQYGLTTAQVVGDDTEPVLNFRITGSGSGTVRIVYWLRYQKDDTGPVIAASKTATVRLNIIPSS